MGLGKGVRLYSFVDNHDVERIYTKLRCKEHFLPVHVLLYTLPGVPSVYYGSEFGIEGKKEKWSDASLRPCLELRKTEGDSCTEGCILDLYKINGKELNQEEQQKSESCRSIVRALGKVYQSESALWYGDYRELQLTTAKYAFARGDVIITINNEDKPAAFDLQLDGTYAGVLSGRKVSSKNGCLQLEIAGNSGEIWIPEGKGRASYEPVLKKSIQPSVEDSTDQKNAGRAAARSNAKSHAKIAEHRSEECAMPKRSTTPKPYEEMTIEELQAEILAKMAANGPVTDRMKQDVLENVYPNSLLNWVKSFQY